jgi:hypothetical protein
MVLTTIPEHYPITYERIFMHELQQKESRLMAAVTRKTGKGRSIKFNRLKKLAMTDFTDRGGDTVYTDADTEHRWCFPTAAEIANRLDEFDGMMIADIEDPKNPLLQAQVYATRRKFDERIISGITATAYEGTEDAA